MRPFVRSRHAPAPATPHPYAGVEMSAAQYRPSVAQPFFGRALELDPAQTRSPHTPCAVAKVAGTLRVPSAAFAVPLPTSFLVVRKPDNRERPFSCPPKDSLRPNPLPQPALRKHFPVGPILCLTRSRRYSINMFTIQTIAFSCPLLNLQRPICSLQLQLSVRPT